MTYTLVTVDIETENQVCKIVGHSY